VPAKFGRPTAGGRQWSGRGVSWQGGGPGLTEWLVHGGGDQWRGEGRRQARAGVTGGVRVVGEGVLGGAMLGVGSRWLEQAIRGGLVTVSMVVFGAA
jgi:hypothetical protein